MRRALNILVYFNPDWKPQYNGSLELWDAQMKNCVKAVSPDFNRCVIFLTSETSFHGLPKPLTVPPGIARRSLAAYYYTPWKETDHSLRTKMTLYQPLPWEYRKRAVHAVKKWAKLLLNPFLRADKPN
jgi:hypothetical protein